MDDIIFMPATKIAKGIKQKKVSSEEVVSAYLDRIEQVNPQLNAIVHLTAEIAIKDAKAADLALMKGEKIGPLHGVPMTIKDSIETKDIVTTSGTKGMLSNIPEKDATVVSKLRSAGAIILGKTNLSEIAIPDETNNLVHGLTKNPYNIERTAGGSSGGEASIIAAGGSAFGIGSDCGGSLREPAHFCGICAIKPTTGRVSMAGHFPPSWGVMNTLWQIGPMARFVEDLSFIFPLIAGKDGKDPNTIEKPFHDPLNVNFKKLKFAFYTNDGNSSADKQTEHIIRKVVSALSDVGMVGNENRPNEINRSREIFYKLCAADGGKSLEGLIESVGSDEIHPLLQEKILLRRDFEMTTTEYFRYRVEFDKWRISMSSFMEEYDLIICPVVSCPAPPHGYSEFKSGVDAYSYVMPYNLTGWPSTVVRAGISTEGLPIGIQIVSRPFFEHVGLATALYVEKVFGGWQRPDL